MAERSSQPPTTGHGADWHEYRFVLILGFIALAVTSIPYFAGAGVATEERAFGGFVYAVSDCYSYLAKMRQGAEGAWLYHLPYTPEPHPGAPFFLFHVLLGKLAALLPGTDLTLKMVLVYHGARWVFGLGLLMTIYRFLTALTGSVRIRRLAWFMTTFGSGLGWLLVTIGRPGWLGSLPLDFILPEGFTFLVLFAFPHIALARTLLLVGLLALLAAWHSHIAGSRHALSDPQPEKGLGVGGWLRGVPTAGLSWLLMGLIVPFYVAVAWAVTGAAWIALTVRERRICWREARAAATVALITAPIVFFSTWRFTTDPVYATWAAQNRILSPHPFHYLAAFGLPLVLACFAAREAWQGRQPTWLALAWVAVVPFLVYLPFNLQRRLVEGVQVPLSLLAALGLRRLVGLDGTNEKLRSGLVVAVVLLVLVPTNVLMVAGGTMSVRGQPSPIFRDRDELAVLDWLSAQVAPSDVVLSSFETGNYLPARARARAFVGHGPETVHADQKRDQVARFFDTATQDAWRLDLLGRYRVDYVFWGPAERALGGFNPSTAPYLQEIHRAGKYVIFSVDL